MATTAVLLLLLVKQQSLSPTMNKTIMIFPSLLSWLSQPMVGRQPVKEDPLPPPQPFAFGPVFGDNMVLQRGSQAAVYGYLGPLCVDVQVALFDDDKDDELVFVTRKAQINVTQQPFGGPEWGVRPCLKDACPPRDLFAFNPWNEPLATWKVLLPPQAAGGKYTIQATCLLVSEQTETEASRTTTASDLVSDDAEEDGPAASILRRRRSLLPSTNPRLPITTVTLTNITFGDVWYCSGQSNMQLPLFYTFSKNETADAIINDNKYSQIRIMAGNSKHMPNGDMGQWTPDKYGAKDGTNAWMTAYEAATTLDKGQFRRLFQFGATCWYFAQELVEMGVTDVPIGLINTAIGGMLIQTYMDNATIGTCHNRSTSSDKSENSDEQPHYEDAQYYGSQVVPFADMTIKGWLWYQGEANMYDVKGNSRSNVGYGCEMKLMIQQWRKVWSKTPGTTPPDAPFGLVTLASSGGVGPDL